MWSNSSFALRASSNSFLFFSFAAFAIASICSSKLRTLPSSKEGVDLGIDGVGEGDDSGEGEGDDTEVEDLDEEDENDDGDKSNEEEGEEEGEDDDDDEEEAPASDAAASAVADSNESAVVDDDQWVNGSFEENCDTAGVEEKRVDNACGDRVNDVPEISVSDFLTLFSA